MTRIMKDPSAKVLGLDVVRMQVGAGFKHVARAICASCGAKRDITLGKPLPPEVIAKKFEQTKWHIDKRGRVTCPDCRAKTKETRMNNGSGHRSGEGLPSPSPQILRQVMGHLEDNFSEQDGAYANGSSDESIAKAVGCHVSAVVKIRETYFGALKEPPELAAIRKDLAALEEIVRPALEDLRARLGKLEEKFR